MDVTQRGHSCKKQDLTPEFSAARLIDEYQIVVNPIVLGSGRTMFDEMDGKMGLALKTSRSFSNGHQRLFCFTLIPEIALKPTTHSHHRFMEGVLSYLSDRMRCA